VLASAGQVVSLSDNFTFVFVDLVSCKLQQQEAGPHVAEEFRKTIFEMVTSNSVLSVTKM